MPIEARRVNPHCNPDGNNHSVIMKNSEPLRTDANTQMLSAGASHTEPQAARALLQIIIVNYQTPELTLACVQSIAEQLADFQADQLFVTLVDNASPDASGERIQQQITERGWSSWVQCLFLNRNRGFAGGNNAALNAGRKSEFVLFLNSDTIVHPRCLRVCLSEMRKDAAIGALTCRLINEDGSIQNSVRRFLTPLRLLAAAAGLPWRFPRTFGWADIEDPAWDRATTRRNVDWIGGAFLMIRRDVLDRVGSFNEQFFFYGEDIELCHRIRKAGYLCRHEPSVTTTHLGGASSDVTRMAEPHRNRYRWEARYLVQRQLYGHAAEALARLTDRWVWQLRRQKARWLERNLNKAQQADAVLKIICDNASARSRGGRAQQIEEPVTTERDAS